ncbi:hypothetical protein GmRootV118_20500 [Variovorax sp. V118]|uniref:hypothetical protein n=1 Tax=Variovorax sp. V118 TaxID=3065954 RepID=UPI0034E85FF7
MLKNNRLTPQRRPKIRKRGPFDLSALTGPNAPTFAQVLAVGLGQLEELPDFSEHKSVAIMSDFGGENHGAQFNTYSFLILGFNVAATFKKQSEDLRRKHKILKPFSEFKFNKLTSGPRSRALPEFLQMIDGSVHGAVVTIAIDKRIHSVFGGTRKESFPVMEEQLFAMGLGRWRGATAEKVLRVCHVVAIFVALLTKAGQHVFWYCDSDAINETARERGFPQMQQIFLHALSMYARHKTGTIGFGKSFEHKSYLDDLLSVTDFAAGIVQDLLTAEETGKEIDGGDEKVLLLRWLAAKSEVLSKIPIQISPMPNGEFGCGLVNITPVEGGASA